MQILYTTILLYYYTTIVKGNKVKGKVAPVLNCLAMQMYGEVEV
jgi:hypothetical protein